MEETPLNELDIYCRRVGCKIFIEFGNKSNGLGKICEGECKETPKELISYLKEEGFQFGDPIDIELNYEELINSCMDVRTLWNILKKYKLIE